LAGLDTISGIPLHPLVVHIPVVLIPLAFIGAVLALFVPRWRGWCLPLTAVFATVSLIGVQLAIQSGEGLEEILDEESAAIERHSQLAEQARPMVLVFVLFAIAAAAIWWLVRREPSEEGDAAARTATLRKLVVPVCALSVLTGALATVWIYRTGHSGAESVWKDAGSEGGDEGEGGTKGEPTKDGAEQQPSTEAGDHDGDGD
ncbi:MAG: DUF2231 domain-containing protein, partial [Aquihabitans sp.]